MCKQDSFFHGCVLYTKSRKTLMIQTKKINSVFTVCTAHRKKTQYFITCSSPGSSEDCVCVGCWCSTEAECVSEGETAACPTRACSETSCSRRVNRDSEEGRQEFLTFSIVAHKLRHWIAPDDTDTHKLLTSLFTVES